MPSSASSSKQGDAGTLRSGLAYFDGRGAITLMRGQESHMCFLPSTQNTKISLYSQLPFRAGTQAWQQGNKECCSENREYVDWKRPLCKWQK